MTGPSRKGLSACCSLQALRQAHQCNSAIGYLTPAMVFLAPQAYLADASLGFLPAWSKTLLSNSALFE